MMNTKIDDNTLAAQMMAGSQEAFCHLYAKYQRLLYLFALKFVKSQGVAEDIAQDVFVLIWNNRQFLDPQASLRSYLYTITRNRVLNFIRDNANRQMVDTLVLEGAMDAGADTLQQVEASELEQVLEQVLGTLSPRQRQVFELSRYQGLSQKEIAGLLQISPATVNEHIANALKTIQRHLGRYYDSYTLFLILVELHCAIAHSHCMA